MALTTSPKKKLGISDRPRVLTQSEIASLRQDMKQSVAWVQAELRRRRENRN